MRALLATSLLLTACAPHPEWYMIPPQHTVQHPSPVHSQARDFVDAIQKDADVWFVQDVKSSEGAPWRWTLQSPEIRVELGNVENRKVVVNFTIHDTTFQDTGPLRMELYLNGNLFDRVTYDSPGDKVYEKPAPKSLLRANAENRLRMHVVNPWQAPDAGVKLGFLLKSAGIVVR